MKESNTKFGQFISEQKLKSSLQGQELAKKLGISLGYLSQLEHGKRLCPDVGLLKKMIKVFDLNTEETNALYDLYSEASGQISPDIAEYIQSSNTVKKALRCARDASATEEMKKAAGLAASEGFSLHIHAIGDKAVTRALDVLCELKGCDGTRTIAHNQLYTDDDTARIINDGGIFFQTTPQWTKNDDYTLQYLGEQRICEKVSGRNYAARRRNCYFRKRQLP